MKYPFLYSATVFFVFIIKIVNWSVHFTEKIGAKENQSQL